MTNYIPGVQLTFTQLWKKLSLLFHPDLVNFNVPQSFCTQLKSIETLMEFFFKDIKITVTYHEASKRSDEMLRKLQSVVIPTLPQQQPNYNGPQSQYNGPQSQYNGPQPQYNGPQPQYNGPQPQYNSLQRQQYQHLCLYSYLKSYYEVVHGRVFLEKKKNLIK
eukprot:Pgem_evm1s756